MFIVHGRFFRNLAAGDGAHVFTGMVVLRAEQMWDRDAVRYMAIHPHFEPIEEGVVVPEYVALFSLGSAIPTWVKKDEANDARGALHLNI